MNEHTRPAAMKPLIQYAEAHAPRKAKARKRIKARRVTLGGRNSDPDKLAWIRSLRCVVGIGSCQGQVEAHHVRVRGSRATDRLVAPACYRHHHEMTPAQVATIYGVDWLFEAEEYEAAWHARKVSGAA